MKTDAYCVNCGKSVTVDGNEVTLKNGRRAVQGKCPSCGVKVTRFLKSKAKG